MRTWKQRCVHSCAACAGGLALVPAVLINTLTLVCGNASVCAGLQSQRVKLQGTPPVILSLLQSIIFYGEEEAEMERFRKLTAACRSEVRDHLRAEATTNINRFKDYMDEQVERVEKLAAEVPVPEKLPRHTQTESIYDDLRSVGTQAGVASESAGPNTESASPNTLLTPEQLSQVRTEWLKQVHNSGITFKDESGKDLTADAVQTHTINYLLHSV